MGKFPFALLSWVMKPHDFPAFTLDESLLTCIIIGQAGRCDGVRANCTKRDVKVQEVGTCRDLGVLSAHGEQGLTLVKGIKGANLNPGLWVFNNS